MNNKDRGKFKGDEKSRKEEVSQKHMVGLRICWVGFSFALLSTVSYLKDWIPYDIGLYLTVICMVFALVVAPIVDHMTKKVT